MRGRGRKPEVKTIMDERIKSHPCDRDEKAFRKMIDGSLKDLVVMAKARNLRELKIETGPLSISIKSRYRDSEGIQDPGLQVAEPRENEIPVAANMVGIFHRALSPYEPPVIEKGRDVVRGQVIGYIESMRLMHEVKSPCSGKVREIKAEENRPVEYGETILIVAGRD
jgi:acetyl-CoA carboxylase biotin carboxyl carrier protein